MSAELLHLLETEDEVIAWTLRESHGQVGVSDKYGDGFGEYDAQVFDRCMKYCDKAGFVRHVLYGSSLLAINGVLRTGLVSAPRRVAMRRVANAHSREVDVARA